ncbi:kinase-like domain-containing protein [Scleroderma yunnanense]
MSSLSNLFHNYTDLMTITLEQVEQRAVNLDDQIDQDNTVPPQVGGGVVVHRGIMRGKGTVVTVKSRIVSGEGATTMQNTLHETYIWSFLRHRNIHPLLGFVTTFEKSAVSIVSEYKTQWNAHDYVQEHPVYPASLLLGVARALHYLHDYPSGPIFHGDIRGKNVLVTDHGSALLTSFSCSSFHHHSSDRMFSPSLLGAKRWIAPEGIEEKGITAKGDVWAFAMTVLELFTRKTPFEDIESDKGLMVRILMAKPDRPSCMRDEWWDLCTPCWEFEPELRPSMIDLVKKIEKIIASSQNPQDRDGNGNGNRDNQVLISQSMDEMPGTTQVMSDFLNATPMLNYSALPIGVSF